MSDNKKNKRTVLITGGTKGIGLATALRFAREGDQCIITYGWGSVEEAGIYAQFEAENLPAPWLQQADVANEEDTKNLMQYIAGKYGSVDVFVSNVSFSGLVKDLDDYSEKGLLKSIEYSTWPLIAYTQQMHKILGQYPRYIIGLSSHGPDRFHVNYDFPAVTKALMEVLIRYLNYHFFDEPVIFNVVRTRPLITDSLLATFGQEWKPFIEKFDIPGTATSLEEVAKCMYMLTSGLMDGIRGQTIIADKGYGFMDGLQHVYSGSKKTH